MTENTLVGQISNLDGFQEVFDWFGYFPSFHDCNICKIELYAENAAAQIDIRAFNISNQVGEDGHYNLNRHAIVSFKFSQIKKLDIIDWCGGVIILELNIAHMLNFYRFTVSPTYGSRIEIEAEKISMELSPFE